MNGLAKKQVRTREHQLLTHALKELGVMPPPARVVRGKLYRGFRLFSASWAEKFDLYDAAKARWKERIARAHPDRGGSHEQAAAINRLWAIIQERFAAFGIPQP